MGSLRTILSSLLQALPPSPVSQADIEKHVADAIAAAKDIALSPEIKKGQWENAIKAEVFKLAKTEGQALKDAETKYYDELQTRLDIALEFTTLESCDQTFTFILLHDLLETQTIASCSHIFSWLESRAPRLTAGMVPQKGKALVLLRTLNDLLRRLSKMGSNTMFCGRILTFLSGVFPLGERSGVNLRGEYGPTWEGVQNTQKNKSEKPAEEDKPVETVEDKKEDDNKMNVDEKPPVQDKPEEDFYNVFWALQLPFSKPPLFATPSTFSSFQESVNRVLPVIKEHTTKERIMMGSRAGASNPLKRKRESDEPAVTNEYFFAKFLTSPDLLDLELKDTHFRRQFLFQLLILLNHLLTFTKAARDTWQSPRNRSLNMDFTLEPAEAQWVQETLTKAMEELKQTTPNGRTFADTVSVIVEREKNWVKWKNEMCPPFDKEPAPSLYEEAKPLWGKLSEREEPWKWRFGSDTLTDVWEMGYRSLEDLENFSGPDDVKSYWKAIQKENNLMEFRKKQLQRMAEQRAAAMAARVQAEADVKKAEASTADASKPEGTEAAVDPTPVPAPAPTPKVPSISVASDPQIMRFEEAKQRISWLALRAARDQHLGLFSKIGTGDIDLLMKAIEAPPPLPKESGSASPLVRVGDGTAKENGSASPAVKEKEDVNMEG